MAKKELFRGLSRIFVVENKGDETEIVIKDETNTEESNTEDTLDATDIPVEGQSDVIIEIHEGGDETEDTAVEDTIESINAEPKPTAESQQPQGDAMYNELTDRLDAIKAAVNNSQHKDALIRDLHKEMEGLKNDFYASLRRPIIKSIIAIHRRMDERLKYIDAKVDATDADYKQLLCEVEKNLRFDSTSILDTLEDEYDLIYFEPTVGEAYNSKEENAIKVEETDNPVLGGTVKDVIYGGFKEAVTGRIWLKANIAVYKSKKMTT